MVSSMSISMARGSCVTVSHQKISTKNFLSNVEAMPLPPEFRRHRTRRTLAFYLGSSCRPCSCSLGQFLSVLVFLFFFLVLVVFFLVRVIELDLFKHG